MKTQFRTIDGKFSRENTGHGMYVETNYFFAEIKRGEQEPHYVGNLINSIMKVKIKQDIPNFKNLIFEQRYWDSERKKNSIITIKSEYYETWREAIKSNFLYFIEQNEILENLIAEREQALINAEL